MTFFPIGWGALVLLLATLLPGTLRAQAPAWQQLSTPGTTAALSNESEVRATATDAVGNVYLVGYFGGTLSFGTTTLTGTHDVFVAKWSPRSQGFEWALQAGTTRGSEVAQAVAVSGGAVYVAGSFDGSGITFGNTTLTNAAIGGGTPDMFLLKLTDTGQVQWAERLGGPAADAPRALVVQGSSIYVGGSFYGPSTTYGGLVLTNAEPTGFTYDDGFVLKLTDVGTGPRADWAQHLGGVLTDNVWALAVQGTQVYIAGRFATGAASFGSQQVAALGMTDSFVAKLSDDGASSRFVWVQQAGSQELDAALALAVHGSQVYVAGAYNTVMQLGAITLGAYSFDTSYDGFVAQLTDAGASASWTWAHRLGYRGSDEVFALLATPAGVYAGGYFNGATARFGPHTLTNPRDGADECFLTRLDANGTFMWATQGGGIYSDRIHSLCRNGSTVYAGGILRPAASFGAITVPTPVERGLGFLASFTDPVLAASSPGSMPTPFQLSPNPASSLAGGTWLQGAAAYAPVQVLDALGRAVLTATADARGAARLRLPAGLAPGLYVVRSGGRSQRLLVE